MSESRKTTLMQMQASLLKKIIISTVIMAVLIAIVYCFNVPNPNMILIAGLVLCSALFGFGGGTVAAVIMLGYTLYFFSTDNSFTQFTPENMQKVIVSLVGIFADMLFVCFLKRAELDAFDQVDSLTEELHSENIKQQHMSLTDSLTGVCNRMALRQDYDSYEGHEVVVMMLDLDDFKTINDTRGHEEGDRILKEIGARLAETFGKEHCYRYGGDEFLVIIPDISVPQFREKLDSITGSKIAVDEKTEAGFSVGYVHAGLDDHNTLRTLISNADERMYEVKRNKKSTEEFETGELYSQSDASGNIGGSVPSEYTAAELKSFLEDMSGKYDLARVVDPIECRIIQIQDDGKISLNESCYGIWNSERKCINCSSALACRTGCHQEKSERFKDNVYHIQSNPVKMTLSNGSVYDAVVELVQIEKESSRAANDREAENIGNRAAHYLSHHDSMTKVLNADAFHELCREMIRNNPDRSWVMITGNIMNFRLVNTLFGDLKGNEILVKTASMLREMSERDMGLCGRLGGDQFAMLIPEDKYNEEDLVNAARILAETFSSGMYTVFIHFGVYLIDDPSIPVSVMCGRANSALRTIREDISRSVAYFDDDILRSIMMEQTVIGSFEEALRTGEFKMYLQPLVGRDGKVIGAEALTRWCRPDGTVIMPSDFIETLENAGLIHKLDMHIWELAVEQLSLWKGTDKAHLTISVNMSAKDFFSIDVYDVLTDLIKRYDVDSSLLRLEITETALLVEPDKSDAIVSRLRSRGFIVEIDDFGKGYSSLGLLKNIKADVLKIDMSFLHEIRDRERNSVILRSVISLADSLGMDVITEGVETEQQLNSLAEMGCRLFQGYYFSRPIPVDAFEAKLLN